MPLKAVIFDLGGVLLRTQNPEPRARWERDLGLRPGELSEVVFNGEAGLAAQLGQIDDDELWERVQERLGLSATRRDALRSDFVSGDRLDDDLVAYIDRLRLTYSVGLLSNASLGLRPMLADPLRLTPHFDHITISAEEGMMKPDSRLYRVSLTRAGAAPADALFVDDFIANVKTARELGMQAVHFRDPATTLDALARLTGVAPS